jgi:hypothetical protein
MGRDCASERVPIALAEGRPEDPRAKASAEIDVAAGKNARRQGSARSRQGLRRRDGGDSYAEVPLRWAIGRGELLRSASPAPQAR